MKKLSQMFKKEEIMITVNVDNFVEEVVNSEVPVIVDFFAPWCGPCKAIAPILEQIANEYEGKLKIVKLDTDESSELATEYGIRSLPTLMFFNDSGVTKTLVGSVSKDKIISEVKVLVG